MKQSFFRENKSSLKYNHILEGKEKKNYLNKATRRI